MSKPKPVVQALPVTVWTIGHSTRPLDGFLGLLHEYRIEAVADVRRFPGSRRYPYFAHDALVKTLPEHGVEYAWLPKLGGRRKAQPDSPNSAWRNAAFRGYADYLASGEFAQGLDDLLVLAERRRTALMCAEAVWWRCHRALIADVLCARGIQVMHVLDAGHCVMHPMTAPARIVAGKLTYVADAQE